jgi:hypothetical protein
MVGGNGLTVDVGGIGVAVAVRGGDGATDMEDAMWKCMEK